jgi:GxxExxY protein
MLVELERRGVDCRQQAEYPIYYKERLIGAQRLDLFVAGDVVTEIEVAPELTRLHKAQTISYLKATGCRVGLLFNFGGAAPQFARLYFERNPPPFTSPETPIAWPADYLVPEITHLVIGGLYEVHYTLGPGYIYRLYANALLHELRLRGLKVVPRTVYQVIYRGRPVGKIQFAHLQVGVDLMVFPVAIQDIGEIKLENLKAWLRHEHLPLGILVNFYPERSELMVIRP